MGAVDHSRQQAPPAQGAQVSLGWNIPTEETRASVTGTIMSEPRLRTILPNIDKLKPHQEMGTVTLSPLIPRPGVITSLEQLRTVSEIRR